MPQQRRDPAAPRPGRFAPCIRPSAALGLAWLCAVAPVNGAEREVLREYPVRPIRFIVPFSPGGGNDIAARVYAANMGARLGQSIVIDNRPGATGSLGVELTARAAPDGYTICVISASHTITAAAGARLPYDLTKDLQPISQITSAFLMLVLHPSVSAKSVKELIAEARLHPGKLLYGSSGIGGISDLAGAMLAHLTKTTIVHVPYRGESAAIVDLLSGRIHMQFATPINARPHVATGRLRALALTSNARSSADPDLPTLAEAGVPGYLVDQWYGIITSRGVPRRVINRLATEIAIAARAAEVVQQLRKDGFDAVSSTPEAFDAHLKAEIAKWRKLIQDAGLKLHQN